MIALGYSLAVILLLVSIPALLSLNEDPKEEKRKFIEAQENAQKLIGKEKNIKMSKTIIYAITVMQIVFFYIAIQSFPYLAFQLWAVLGIVLTIQSCIRTIYILDKGEYMETKKWKKAYMLVNTIFMICFFIYV